MAEQDKGRFDRSRYGSGARSNSQSNSPYSAGSSSSSREGRSSSRSRSSEGHSPYFPYSSRNSRDFDERSARSGSGRSSRAAYDAQQGQGRYHDAQQSQGRYYDGFFDDMRIPEEEPAQSFSSRLGIEHTRRQLPENAGPSGTGPLPVMKEPREGSYADSYDYYEDEEFFEDEIPDAAPVRRRSYSRAAVEEEIAARSAQRAAAGAGAAADAGAAAADDDAAGSDSGTVSASRASERVANRKKKSRGKKILIGTLCVLAVVVLVGAGVAFAYLRNIESNLHKGVDDQLMDVLVDTNMADEPFYMLLLGTDKSQWREERNELDGSYRSDTMILTRVDAKNRKITLVTIPRDIPVDMGQYGTNKINSAYTIGGPAFAVETVSKLAGVPISHYAEVDFDGFAELVDAVGGVEVNVPIVIDDENSGAFANPLYPGEQTLNGDQALIFVRSRHAYDDIADGDALRAANQRQVISAIAQKALAADIATIANTVQTVSQYVTTDLGLNDIIGLAQLMRGLDSSSDVYTATAPTTSQYIGGGWYEYLNQAAWEQMMERVKAGLPPTEEAEVDPHTGIVMASGGEGSAGAASATSAANFASTIVVKNATDISGLASQLRSKLMEAGYQNIVLGEVKQGASYPKTLVVYKDASREAEAQALLDQIGQGEAFLDTGGTYNMSDCDLLVIIGDNWKS